MMNDNSALMLGNSKNFRNSVPRTGSEDQIYILLYHSEVNYINRFLILNNYFFHPKILASLYFCYYFH